MDTLIDIGGTKTIEMPLIKVRNLHSQIEELKTERRKLKRENDRLQKEVAALRAERIAERLVRGSRQVVPTLDLDRELKLLIANFHPDKHPDNPLAHEITVALNKLRETRQR
jgi:predicted RNase H-like nuclease (RuvC/YqgF family)